jgi:hypothetical protein
VDFEAVGRLMLQARFYESLVQSGQQTGKPDFFFFFCSFFFVLCQKPVFFFCLEISAIGQGFDSESYLTCVSVKVRLVNDHAHTRVPDAVDVFFFFFFL